MLNFRHFTSVPNYTYGYARGIKLNARTHSSFLPLFSFLGGPTATNSEDRWSLYLYNNYRSRPNYEKAITAFDPTIDRASRNSVYIKLRDQSFLILAGAIFEVLRGDHSTFSRAGSEIILRPLLVIGINEYEYSYVAACMNTRKRTPDKGAFQMYIHPELDVPKTSWPGVRTMWRRIKANFEGVEIMAEAPETLIVPPRIPTFDTEQERDRALKRVHAAVFK